MKHIHIPNLFWLVGQPDNGKTTISNWFQQLLGCEVIHTDQLYHSWIEKNYPQQLKPAKQNIRGHYPRMTKEWQREWHEYATKIILQYVKRAKLDLVVEGWLMFYIPDDLRKKIEAKATVMQIHMRRYVAHAAQKTIRPQGRDYTNSVKALCSLMAKAKGVTFMRHLVKYQSFEDIRDFQGVSDSCGKLLALSLPEALAGQHVLDVGCSTGYFTIRCAQRGAIATGIDKQLSNVRAATRLARAVYRLPDVKLVHGDFYTADLPAGFDYILAVNFISSQGDKLPTFFERCFELLNPGGKLIVETVVSAVQPSHPKHNEPFIEHVNTGNGRMLVFPNEHALAQLANAYKLTFRGRSVRMHGDRRNRVYHFTKPKTTAKQTVPESPHTELVGT
jgi:SAM-dependent methyltransferase